MRATEILRLRKVGAELIASVWKRSCPENRGNRDSIFFISDRLGIPLVEIATAPDIKSPRHAREVAEYIGMVLRSTGKVKRGLGTIRQDVNISIARGARVEIKGVQALTQRHCPQGS